MRKLKTPTTLTTRKIDDMTYKINYGTSVGVFPSECKEQIKRASLCDMKVLWLLCSGDEVCVESLAAFAGTSESDVVSSLMFWKNSGVLDFDLCGENPVSISQKPSVGNSQTEKSKKLMPEDDAPNYTNDELAKIIENNGDIKNLVAESQRIIGKMLNYHEIKILVSLRDYMCLESDYILLLLNYCARHGKKSIPYLRNTATGLYSSDITTVDELSEELQRRENAASVEGRIRSMFGLGDRAFTAKEKKEISVWVNDFGYGIDIIQKAYEVTADATGKASLHYANSVLDRWNSENLRTVEQIETANIQYSTEIQQKKNSKKKTKDEPVGQSSSFDTDEFFAAAVKRSLGGGEEK